jgi:hypothetical protein
VSLRAEAARRGHGLRGRLLAAFVLVAVPPLLLFAVFVMALLSDRLERAAGQRLRQGLDGVRARVGALQHQAETAVAAIVRADLARPASSEEDARQMAATLGERHGLPLLEIVDGSGRVLSSRQWPAASGCRKAIGRSRAFSTCDGRRWRATTGARSAWPWWPRARLRGEACPSSCAAASRWMRRCWASCPTSWARRSRSATPPADAGWPARFSLAQAPGFDPVQGEGTTDVSGTAYRWAAAPLGASLWEVVAVPHTLLADVTGDVGS